jgi:hypothetical protein
MTAIYNMTSSTELYQFKICPAAQPVSRSQHDQQQNMTADYNMTS